MNKQTSKTKLVLTDFYHQPTQRLLASLNAAGISYQHVNINYDGFLPTGILNPFAHAIGADSLPDKDLHYNEIRVPDFYEIRNTDGARAEILLGDVVRGYVVYAPSTNRLVREVQWLDRRGVMTYVERFNRQGFKYAEALLNSEGKEVKTLYFNVAGQQVLTVDVINRSVLVEASDSHPQPEIFATITAFAKNYLDQLSVKFDEVLFNSLSTPFFVTNLMTGSESKPTLYFQEPINKEIPGNMQLILDGKTPTQRILFENAKELGKVQQLAANPQVRLDYLGAIEEIKRENSFRPLALTITRSDQILYDEVMAQTLAELGIKWTIAAPSEISDKLRSFAGKYPGVAVREAISEKDVAVLLAENDLYLDLNQGAEWGNIIQRAYLEGLLVLTDMKVTKNAGYELILEKDSEILGILRRPEKAMALRVLREKKGKPASSADYQRLLLENG